MVAFTSALVQGMRHRVAAGRLDIFVHVAPLPGQPVDHRGTSWRLIADDDVDNGERATIMVVNGRRVTGSTACRDYLASYEMSEGSVRFPSVSMLGSVESCSESARRGQGEFTDFLSSAWEYSVSAEERTARLRITKGIVLVEEDPAEDDNRGGERSSDDADIVVFPQYGAPLGTDNVGMYFAGQLVLEEMYLKRTVSLLARKAARLTSFIGTIMRDEIWRHREFQAFLLFMFLLLAVLLSLIGGCFPIPFQRGDVIIG